MSDRHLRELLDATMEPVKRAITANVEVEDQELALDMAGSVVWLVVRCVFALERIADALEHDAMKKGK
jgi:hypothetical protein